MTGQIVEITKPGYRLHKSRGFLEVTDHEQKIGKVALSDIEAVIVAVPGCSISTVLIEELSNLDVPLVICGGSYLPSCLILPVQGYGRQFQVMRSQVELSEPRRKRAWQKVVRAKITNQGQVLERVGKKNLELERLVKKVRSGDIENCEAQAARIYWKCLFGREFRRNRTLTGVNLTLNYTYTVVRACIARGVSGAGLHPTFSLHHRNPTNPINLVDDLMEPLRPIADYVVWKLGSERNEELNPERKATLAAITTLSVPLSINRQFTESSPLSLASVKICRSFANYCQGKENNFLIPQLPNPLELTIE